MRLRNIQKALRFRNAFSFLLGAVLFLGAVLVLSQSIVVLQVVDETDQPLIIHPVESGTRFSHQYRHSVAKCPIIEKFELDNQSRMVLMESWNCSFGAGIATEPPPGASDRLVDGFYVIEDIGQVVPELFFHPVAITDHRLTVENQTWNLSEPPFEGQTIRLTIEQTTRWRYWVHVIQAG
ncbi:DUF1850 domain-containing protein [Desmospora profundinema]|uniref:DUF1850 domain-containing protein n=1 Tax=Desmospora profundinema TaxID=1571184 RepID=A0ABU1IIH0_9BACL|nr:DUF1850 domain-containing protein [Desmospora profundinema]MDR6224561.1 hypothetical protein [Desmospora profundinema]